MLNMRQKAIVVIVSALAAVLTAGLIRATFTYDVELVSNPSGPVVAAPVEQPFNISCRLAGGDADNISSMRWLGPNSSNLAESHQAAVVKSEDRLLLLTLTHPTSEDSGTYKCEAQYANNYHLVYAVEIVFHGPAPAFDVSYENTTVEEGDAAEFHCFARGETPMTYTWYNQSDDAVSVSNSPNGSWLVVPVARPSHEGMYSCNANNTHGLDSKLFYLAVSPKTGNNDTDNDTLVDEDFRVVNVSATSVSLYVSVSGFVRTVQFKYRENYEKVEVRRQFSPAPDNTYSIENLIPAGSYEFQFRVLPPAHNDTWSEVVRATLLPRVPEIIVRRQQGGSLEMEWFSRMDDRMRGTIDQHEIKYYTVSMRRGNEWVPSECAITVQIPSCKGWSFVISGLQQKTYYMIELRAHTASGYGGAAKHKIYVSD